MREETAQRLMGESGCPMVHRTRRVEPGSSPAGWTKTLEGLASRLQPDSGGVFALCGEFQAGKTQLVVEVIRRACAKLLRSQYTTSHRLFAAGRDAMGMHEEVAWMRRMTSVPVLAIDEISDRGDTDYEGRMLRELIDLRYGFGPSRMTLLVSNAKAEALEASLGQKIVRRIAESGGVIDCGWGPIGGGQ